MLCDPLPDSRITTQNELEDLQKVGQFLYQMVMLRKPSNRHGWKATNTKEWKVFGDKSQQWLDFCNLLLNASYLPEGVTVEICLEKLKELKSPPRKTVQLTFRMIGIVLLFIMIGLIISLLKPKSADQSSWDSYVQVYRVWSAQFHDTLDSYLRDDASRRTAWAEAGLGELTKVYPHLNYPGVFLKEQGENLDFLKSLKPGEEDKWPKFGNFDSKPRAEELEQVRMAAEKILALLAEGGWSYLSDLKAFEDRLEFRRADLADLMNVNPAESCADAERCNRVLERIERVIEIHPSFAELQGLLDGLEQHVEQAGYPSHQEPIRVFLARLYGDSEWADLGVPGASLKPLERLGGWMDSLAQTYQLAQEALDTDPDNRAQVDRVLGDLLKKLQSGGTPGEEFCGAEQAKLGELIIDLKKYQDMINEVIYTIPQFQQLWKFWSQWSLSEAGKGKDPLLHQYREVFPEAQENLRLAAAAFEEAGSLPSFSAVSWQEKHRVYYEKAYQEALNGLSGELQKVACDGWAEKLKILYPQGLEDLKRTSVNLRDLSRLESGLADWYQLDESLPDSGATLALLETQFPADSGFRNEKDFQDIFAQVQTLREIEKGQVNVQKDSAVVRYAQWRQMEKLNPDSRAEYLEEYRALKESLPASRGALLEERIERRAREVLLDYHQSRMKGLMEELGRLWAEIDSRGLDFPVFGEFVELSRQKTPAVSTQMDAIRIRLESGTSLAEEFSEIYAVFKEQEAISGRVRDFLGTAEWRNPEKYNKRLFVADKLREAETFFTFFSAGGDPLSQYRGYEKREEIFTEIDNFLAEIHTQLRSESGPEAEEAARLVEGVGKELDENRKKAVAAYEDDIMRGIRNPDGTLWRRLKEAEDLLTPIWCRILKLEGDQVVFKEASFAGLFEPVQLTGDENAPFPQKKWEKLNSRKWQELKERGAGVNPLQQSFFEVFLKEDICWPRYIRSIVDDTVVFRYIPSEGGIPAFYLAIRETTYEQYVQFLKKETEIKRPLPPLEPSINKFWWPHQEPITRNYTLNKIKSSKDIFEESLSEYPAVWIPFDDAHAYASWLGKGDQMVGLPTVEQHKRANRFIRQDEGKDFHFADEKDLEQAWKRYEIAQKNKKSNPNSCPSGVFVNKKEFIEEENIKIVNDIFPRKTTVGRGSKGIHDLQGNVWEWCMEENQHILCGYSSLTPLVYRDQPDSYTIRGKGEVGDYEYQVQPRCDVGFRIMVNIFVSASK